MRWFPVFSLLPIWNSYEIFLFPVIWEFCSLPLSSKGDIVFAKIILSLQRHHLTSLKREMRVLRFSGWKWGHWTLLLSSSPKTGYCPWLML